MILGLIMVEGVVRGQYAAVVQGTPVPSSSKTPIHEVSRWLGHRSIKVTVDQYGHLTQDGHERCRQVVEVAVGPYMLTAGRVTAEHGAESVLG
ncbi:hypothetical protein FHX80_11206 [Streptomyces brevispora]|uniref:Integrase-like protein n=1 Tax=Streptomyces brevispora TaxID=887462 RepID=A0A561UR24_9ACTN|nr:hypothetical protein FHX80_11206 [Streptomyces brevispora]